MVLVPLTNRIILSPIVAYGLTITLTCMYACSIKLNLHWVVVLLSPVQGLNPMCQVLASLLTPYLGGLKTATLVILFHPSTLLYWPRTVCGGGNQCVLYIIMSST